MQIHWLLLICQPHRDGRLRQPNWLTIVYIQSGYLSTIDWDQVRKSPLAEDKRRNQLSYTNLSSQPSRCLNWLLTWMTRFSWTYPISSGQASVKTGCWTFRKQIAIHRHLLDLFAYCGCCVMPTCTLQKWWWRFHRNSLNLLLTSPNSHDATSPSTSPLSFPPHSVPPPFNGGPGITHWKIL